MMDVVPADDEDDEDELSGTALSSAMFRHWSVTRSQRTFSMRSTRSGWTEILEDETSPPRATRFDEENAPT